MYTYTTYFFLNLLNDNWVTISNNILNKVKTKCQNHYILLIWLNPIESSYYLNIFLFYIQFKI